MMTNADNASCESAPQASSHEQFSDLTSRLEDIATKIRAKDISLAQTLDLFDEAIALGSQAVSMVDEPNFEDVRDDTFDEVSDHMFEDVRSISQDEADVREDAPQTTTSDESGTPSQQSDQSHTETH